MSRQARILLPPGLGDIHWCLLRLRGILKVLGLDEKPPLLFVSSISKVHDRSADFIRALPWAEFGGYFDCTAPERRRVFIRAANHGEVFRDWEGFDLFLCVNRQIELGHDPASIFPEAGPPDWDYPITTKPCSIALPSKPFIEITFYRHGHYREWWQHLEPRHIVKELLTRTDFDLALTGAKWDVDVLQPVADLDKKRIHNLVGKTSFDDLLALKLASSGFVGHQSGSGMLSQHFKIPTVMIWCHHPDFTPGMWNCYVRPEMKNGGHRALDVHLVLWNDVVDALLEARKSLGS